MVATETKCLRCGAALSAGAIEGFCQSCLASVAFAASVEDESISTGGGRPARLGAYELIQEIGRGGMGVVYRARQLGLEREVAVKVLRSGPFADASEVARFRQEASAAAALRHPNIVSVHEVGEADGHAFFSMDLVRGQTLADLTREGPLVPARAARYVRLIAEAVANAHAHGILHRDLKPANVIIDADDQPRVTDFGLAKRLDIADATLTQQVVGSPGYMPPEQADPQRGKLTLTSDVYALGALLYHLLTSRPPFSSATIPATLAQLLNSEPVQPRRLNPAIPVDLETVCLKCLQKEQEQRYASAQELADELGRFLRDEPIRARPVNPPEKLWRWARRKPLLASMILLVHLVGAMGLAGILWQWRRAEQSADAEHRQRSAAQSANRELQQANLRLAETVGFLQFERAEAFFRADDAANGIAHLAAMLRSNPSNHLAANRLVSALIHRRWALPSTRPMRHRDQVRTACFSPDARFVVTASGDKTAQVWDAASGLPLVTLVHEDAVFCARYSPDGRRIVTASGDGSARIWDAFNGSRTTPPLGHSNKVYWAEFSADATSVVTASADGTARIWDATNGSLKRELRSDAAQVIVARFEPNGTRIVTGDSQGSIRLWTVDTGEMLHQVLDGQSLLTSLCFSPDGRQLLSASEDGIVCLWDAATGDALGEPLVHSRPVWHAQFSPDSKILLTACEDGAARVWDVQTLRPVCEPLRHQSGVIFGQFSADARTVLTTSSDNTARLWEMPSGVPLCQPLRHIERVLHAEFSHDNRRVVTASLDGIAQVWELHERLKPGTEIRHDVKAMPLAFSTDGAVLLTAAHDKAARLWDASTGLALTDPISHADSVSSGDIAPDGRRFVTACGDGSVRIWDCGQWNPAAAEKRGSPRLLVGPFGHSKGVFTVRFNTQGSQLVTASADGTARVWDSTSGRPITPLLVHADEVLSAQFSRDGRTVVTASRDRTARVWDAQSGRAVTQPLQHLDYVHWAEFSPDAQKVVTASTDNTACIWDVRTSQRILPPLQHPRTVGRAIFSPDGRLVATASIDRTARIWDASTGQALTPPLSHDHFVERLFFTSDGQRLFTTCRSGLARAWDSSTGRPLTEWLNAGPFWGACFDPVGETIAVSTAAGAIHLWQVPRAPSPVPVIFLDFAEALAGIRLSERGNIVLVPPEELGNVAKQLAANETPTFYERLAQSFLTGPKQRAN